MIGRYERASASPAMAVMLATALGQIDVRDILPTIPTKTLVLCRHGDQLVSLAGAEALASAMPNAEFRQLPDGAHAVFDTALGTATSNSSAALGTVRPVNDCSPPCCSPTLSGPPSS